MPTSIICTGILGLCLTGSTVRVRTSSPLLNITTNTSSQSDDFGPLQNLIFDQLRQVANHSWEWGVEAEAILEIYYPCFSVFSKCVPGPVPVPLDLCPEQGLPKLHGLLDPILSQRNASSSTLVDGDGASGDPVSLEVATLILNATTNGGAITSDRTTYGELAKMQMDHLLQDVPRTPDGAISQREDVVQLWSDYVSMAPPGIAFYGALHSNLSLLHEAYLQCRTYRSYLRDPVTNLWRHILLGTSTIDTGLWSTGNGWAAMGMMRVLQTLEVVKDTSLRRATEESRREIAGWVGEIVDAAWGYQGNDSLLLPNYFNRSDERAFDECSGTALIAAATFRLAAYNYPNITSPAPTSLSAAENAGEAILTRYVDRSTGIISPVVDPLNWNSIGKFNGTSPEGQGFVLFLIAAWKDWAEIRSGDPKVQG